MPWPSKDPDDYRRPTKGAGIGISYVASFVGMLALANALPAWLFFALLLPLVILGGFLGRRWDMSRRPSAASRQPDDHR